MKKKKYRVPLSIDTFIGVKEDGIKEGGRDGIKQ